VISYNNITVWKFKVTVEGMTRVKLPNENSYYALHLCLLDSWCSYQRSHAIKRQYEHKDTMPASVMEILKPRSI